MTVRKTISSIFIAPTVVPRNVLHDNQFINAYAKDSRKEVQYEDAVYLLFCPKNIQRFQEFVEEEYEDNTLLIDDYDYEDGFIVLVYKLPLKHNLDYELIKQGRYSETSEKFQNLFPKVIKIVKSGLHKDELSLQFRIFKKSGDLKEYWEEQTGMEFSEHMEVWPGWDEDKETLDLDKIKEQMYENA